MNCSLCDKPAHYPNRCIEYDSIERRCERADELGLCLRCLRGPRGHGCSAVCYICNGGHHQALCTVRHTQPVSRPCTFCDGPHFDCRCPVYKTAEERTAQVDNLGICVRCFTGSHPRSAPCLIFNRGCFYCGSGDHNRALCPKQFGTSQQSHRSSSRSSKKSRSSSSSSRSRSRSRSRRRAPSRGRSHGRLPATSSPSRRRSSERARRFGRSPARRPYSKSPLRRRSSVSPLRNGHNRFVIRTGRPAFPCVFCRGGHFQEACKVIRTAAEREKFIRDKGLCLRCTRPGHPAKDCHAKNSHRPCHACGLRTHITPLCPQQFPSEKQSASANTSSKDAPRITIDVASGRQQMGENVDQSARRDSSPRGSPSTRRSPVSTRNPAWNLYQPPAVPQGVPSPTVSATEKTPNESPTAVVASVAPSPVPADDYLFGFLQSNGYASSTNANAPVWPSTSSAEPQRNSASSDDIEVLKGVQSEKGRGEKEKGRKKRDEETRERRKKSSSRERDEKLSKKTERENSAEREELEKMKAQLAKEKNELAKQRTSIEATERGIQEREAHVAQREREAQQKEQAIKAEDMKLAIGRQKLEHDTEALKDAQVALEEQRKQLQPETPSSNAPVTRTIKQEIMDAQEQEDATERLKKREAAVAAREKELKQREAKVKADEDQAKENTAEINKLMQGLGAQKKNLDAEQKALDEKRRLAAGPTTSQRGFDANLDLEEANMRIELLQKEVADLKRQLENAKTDAESRTKERDQANESVLEQMKKRRELQERCHCVEAELFRARAENEAHVLSLKFRDEFPQAPEQATPQPTPTGMRTVKQEVRDSTDITLASAAAAGPSSRPDARKRSMQPSPDSSTSPKRPRQHWDEAAIAVLKEKLEALAVEYASENAKFTVVKYGVFAVENVGRVSGQTEKLAEFLKRAEPTNATITDRVHQIIQEI